MRRPNEEVLRGTQDVSGTKSRRRRLRPLPWSRDSDTESDAPEQPRQARCQPLKRKSLHKKRFLSAPNRGRYVVPRRDGELPATVPASQTALIAAGRRVSPERVPMHVLDASEEDLDDGQAPRWHSSSEFALHVQNRFAALDPTVRDSSVLRPTSDGSGVEAFPDAAVEVSMEPVIRRPFQRLVLIPQSQGTPQSIQDRQHDESDDDAREQFRVSHHGDTQRGSSDHHAEDGFEDDTESVEWSLQGDREVNASSDEEGEVVVARPRGPDLTETFRTLDDVSVIPIFEQRVDEHRAQIPPRSIQECIEDCHGEGVVQQ